MKKIFITFILILPLLISNSALAAMKLDITPNNVSINCNIADLDTGYIQKDQATTLNIISTPDNWKVFIKTNNANMGTIGTYTKPISDLQWQATGDYATQTNFIPITNFDIEVGRGLASAQKLKIFINYNFLLYWDKDLPGSYTITLTYTLTTQ